MHKIQLLLRVLILLGMPLAMVSLGGCTPDTETIPPDLASDAGAVEIGTDASSVDSSVVDPVDASGPTPPPTSDAGVVDPPIDGGQTPPPEVPVDLSIECISPAPGAMVTAQSGDLVPVLINVVGITDELMNLRIGGLNASVSADGRAMLQYRVDVGVQNLLVEADTNDGRRFRELCSFVAAPQFASPLALLPGSTEIRLSPGALDDDDPGSSLSSLDDLLTLTLDSGLLTQVVDLGLPTGLFDFPPIIIPEPCPDGMICTVGDPPPTVQLDTYEFTEATPTQPGTSSLSPIVGGLSFLATGETINLNVHVTGISLTETILVPLPGNNRFEEVPAPIDSVGTITIDTMTVDADLSVDLDAASLARVALASLNSVRTVGITVDFPDLAYNQQAVRDLVEVEFQGAPGDTFRADTATPWVDSIAKVLTDTFRGLSVPSTSLQLPTVESTTDVNVTSAVDGIDASADGLTFSLAGSVEGSPTGTLMVSTPALASDLPLALTGIHTRISGMALNQALYAGWSRGGLSGALNPDRLESVEAIVLPEGALDPSTVLRPNSIQVDTSIAPTVISDGAGGLRITLGGVVAQLDGEGPFLGSVEVHFGIVATAGLDNLTSGLRVNSISALPFATTRPLTEEERVTIRGAVALIGQHLANLALAQGGAALALPSFALPFTTTAGGFTLSTGVLDGTRLGHTYPAFTSDLGAIEVSGPFGQLP